MALPAYSTGFTASPSGFIQGGFLAPTLRTLSNAPANSLVYCVGIDAPGDAGAGAYYWNATSTLADNGASVFQVTGVSVGRWIRTVMAPLNLGGGFRGAATRNPGPLDDVAHGYPVGALWLNTATNIAYTNTSNTAGQAVWAVTEFPFLALPGDMLSTTPVACYGMVLLRKSYGGNCIKVNRQYDNFQFNVGFTSAGLLDVATLSLYLSSATGAGLAAQVTTWYDQSGNGYDATQATVANMPWIYRNSINGHMSLCFDGQQSTVVKSLTMPIGVSLTHPALALVAVGRLTSSRALNATLVEAGTSHQAGLYFSANILAGAAGADFTTDTNVSALQPGDHEPSVFIGTSLSGAGGASLWINESNGTAFTNTSTQTITGGLIGNSAVATGNQLNGDLLAVMVYGYGLTAAMRTAVAGSCYNTFGLAPQYIASTILFDGDSMTVGVNGLGWFGFSSLVPEQAPMPLRAYNTGVSGQTMQTLQTNYPTIIAPLYNAAAGQNFLVLLGGTNDAAAGAAAVTTWGYCQAYIAAAAATGWKVIVMTMLPRNSVEPFRIIYNSLIRAGALAAGAVAICDIAANPQIGPAGANTNLTYYYSDQIHPNDLGHAIITSMLVGILNTLVQ